MSGRKKFAVLLLAVVIVAAAWAPCRTAWFAARLGWAVRSLAAGYTAEDLPVVTNQVTRSNSVGTYKALTYRPSGKYPSLAVVLAPGVSELGCYHPRLQALARAMAAEGFLVVTPDIVEFRDFQIAPEGLDQLEFWFRSLREIDGGGDIRKAGLAGISFSGTLAVMTAARPAVRDSVAFVLAVGAYYDIHRCTAGWFRAGTRTLPEGQYPTRFYAKWIVMQAALDLLSDASERLYLRRLLRALLLQKPLPEAADGLSADALRWKDLALLSEDREDPELAALIEHHLTPILYSRLSPGRFLPDVRCPVFLVHGSQDDLIPPRESVDIERSLTGTTCRLLITPFLTHTHPMEKPLGLVGGALAAAEMIRFFYSFADTLR